MSPALYLARFGAMNHVAAFAATSGSYERGQSVVLQTHRGIELGEILGPIPSPAPPPTDAGQILRPATPDDLAQARLSSAQAESRFKQCAALFEDGLWPIVPVDAEVLLPPSGTILHYLGPHDLDATGLVEILRDRYRLDVALEPVGPDTPSEDERGCGSCGESSGGCGGRSEGDQATGCGSCALASATSGGCRS